MRTGLAITLFALSLVSCRRVALVGSLTCSLDRDCAPPQEICGADGRCVPGCGTDPAACIAGSMCNAATGQCTGGMLGSPCADDSACDPPALVCSVSSHTCVAGCTLSSACAIGFVCNDATGHCCDPSAADCPRRTDMGTPPCNSDSECALSPANICSGGACVPGCASTGCTAPQICDMATGHCALASCASDADCDPGSYCTAAATCAVLAFGGPIPCAGGTVVSYQCAIRNSPSDFAQCAGAPGPVGCPYCIDGSCFHPGLCQSAKDCHRGDSCTNGLCKPTAPCATTVALADVVAGKYAAGKEVCVSGKVSSRRSGYDGMIEIKLGLAPYLFVDEEAMYQASGGVRLPNDGETITVHGTVRWDQGHNDRELLPVDWVSP